MRPDDRDLDDEIRGHMALSVKERVERGEDPEAARLAALREFGYVPAIRDSMRRTLVGQSAFTAHSESAAGNAHHCRLGRMRFRRERNCDHCDDQSAGSRCSCRRKCNNSTHRFGRAHTARLLCG